MENGQEDKGLSYLERLIKSIAKDYQPKLRIALALKQRNLGGIGNDILKAN